jgi:hypothetical protein
MKQEQHFSPKLRPRCIPLAAGFMVFCVLVSGIGRGPGLVARAQESPEEAAAMEQELQDTAPASPESSADNEAPARSDDPEAEKANHQSYIIFDDKKLLDGYKKKYSPLSKEILLAMIKDYNLNSYKSTAAVMVFNEKYAPEVVSKEKRRVEKILLRRLARTESPFLQVEIMYTLCCLDRYRYFKSMVPGLIQKLNHYNATVNEIAFKSLQTIIDQAESRTREARIVFNTLRKIMFLSRRRLAEIDEPQPKLARKLKLLRWSVKVLGTQELQRLPEEVLHLL